MIFLEALLISILAVLFIDTSLSDFRSGRIKNKSIIIALFIGLPIAAIYYCSFAQDCFFSFFINVSMGLLISLLLYAYGIWGAGDSKLLVTTIALFPARIYCIANRSLASCFLLIAVVFVVAFLYVVLDTIILGIKQKDLFSIQFQRISWKEFIRCFLFVFFLLNIVNRIISLVLPNRFLQDTLLLAFIHFSFVLIGMYLANKVKWPVVIILGVIWIISILSGAIRFKLSGINYASYFVILILMIFRSTSNKYNYKTIKISELRSGMILSVGSVMMFSNSRVKGLPTFTTEDLKSRLSVQEVESINRWSVSRNGKDTIVIVRKIPFAFFIAIGTLFYLILEVMSV